MSRSVRRFSPALLTVLAALMGASVAWACTPENYVPRDAVQFNGQKGPSGGAPKAPRSSNPTQYASSGSGGPPPGGGASGGSGGPGGPGTAGVEASSASQSVRAQGGSASTGTAAAPTGRAESRGRGRRGVEARGNLSERSAAGDLSSGFNSAVAAAPARGWSDVGPPAEDAGSRLAIGAGLLGLGLVAFLAGSLVATVRRRRATAAASDVRID